MAVVNLFAFGFYPNSRSAEASPARRLGWKLKSFRKKLIHHHNFGDFLSYYLVDALSKSRVSLAQELENGKFLAIGSILWALQDQDVIWGSGAYRENHVPSRTGTRCVAVRGPLTLRELKNVGSVAECCEPLFFDPAILLPLVKPALKSHSKVKGKTTLIPHYSDIERLRNWQKAKGHSLSIIDPMKHHPLKVAEEIAQSERVVSSSLHGIILADSLGVPVVPFRFEGNHEPHFKYVDYYEGSGRSAPRFSTDLMEALDRNPKSFLYEENDLKRFLHSFPFVMKDLLCP